MTMAFWQLCLLKPQCVDGVNLTAACVNIVVIMTVAAVCLGQDALDEEILNLDGTLNVSFSG